MATVKIAVREATQNDRGAIADVVTAAFGMVYFGFYMLFVW